MQHYLDQHFDWRGATLSDAYDELPLWSAVPGNLLLENLPYRGVSSVVDIGCGTGFPLLLLARRFGPETIVYGVDPWENAMARTARKIEAWGLLNVNLLQTDATKIPLAEGSIDLITSNLGLNNFDRPDAVLAECHRLLRPNGKLCMSTNLIGTFGEFYAAFETAAKDYPEIATAIRKQADHRQGIPQLRELLENNRFEVVKVVEQTSTFTYANGTAFLSDYFTVMGFLPSWKALVPSDLQRPLFEATETLLNAKAAQAGALRLTVPWAYLEARPIL
jgi:arsenite methyltransferase